MPETAARRARRRSAGIRVDRGPDHRRGDRYDQRRRRQIARQVAIPEQLNVTRQRGSWMDRRARLLGRAEGLDMRALYRARAFFDARYVR